MEGQVDVNSVEELAECLEGVILDEARQEAARRCEGGILDPSDTWAVEEILDAKLERLKDVIHDSDRLANALVSSQEDELEILRKTKAELQWQVLLETSKTLTSTKALVAVHKSEALQWHSDEFAFLTEYLQVAKLKSDSLRGEMEEATYGPSEQEMLQKIGEVITEQERSVESSIAEMEAKLQQLSHLPEELVKEHSRVLAAINEREEYIKRLGA